MRVQLTRCLSTRVPVCALNSQCTLPSMLRGRPIQVWQALLSLTYGHTVSTYVPGHNLSHHKYTQQPKDVMRTTKLRFNWNLWNGLFFQQSVVSFEFFLKALVALIALKQFEQCIAVVRILTLKSATKSNEFRTSRLLSLYFAASLLSLSLTCVAFTW